MDTLKARHRTVGVDVGGVTVGGGAPIVVQSMTNTDTADVESTAQRSNFGHTSPLKRLFQRSFFFGLDRRGLPVDKFSV